MVSNRYKESQGPHRPVCQSRGTPVEYRRHHPSPRKMSSSNHYRQRSVVREPTGTTAACKHFAPSAADPGATTVGDGCRRYQHHGKEDESISESPAGSSRDEHNVGVQVIRRGGKGVRPGEEQSPRVVSVQSHVFGRRTGPPAGGRTTVGDAPGAEVVRVTAGVRFAAAIRPKPTMRRVA